MKNKLTRLILPLLLLAVAACKKEVAGPQADFMAAKKGENEWITKTQEVNTAQDSLYLFGNVGEEHLSMHFKFKGIGKYILTGGQVRYMVTVGQDVVVAEYLSDPEAESVLNVTAYDEDKKIIYGNFTLNALRYYRYDSLDNYFAKKLTFTSGAFKITATK